MSDDHSASALVTRHTELFGKSIIEALIPNPIDGLKYVHRRILTIGYNDARFQTNHFVKCMTLVSATMELHPHGDSSIYRSIVRMAQSFEYNPAMIVIEGNFGSYSTPNPADARYPSLKITEFTKDVFYAGVNYRALPKQLDELQTAFELSYFVPTIPTALLYANSTIGFGFGSETVPHNLADVCDLVVAYTQHQTTHPVTAFDYTKHAEKFLPDFPTFSTLTNHHELITAYRHGAFNTVIRSDGEVRLTADAIYIHTLPYGIEFETLKESIEALLIGPEKGSFFDRSILSVNDLFPDKTRDAAVVNLYGNICVKIKRGINVFEVWEQLRRKIKFSATYSPNLNYNEAGYATAISPPNLLALWYEIRYNILVASKKMQLTTMTQRLREVEALLIICDHVDQVITILRTNTRKDGVEHLQKEFDLSQVQAEYIAAARLDSLALDSKEVLASRRDGINNELTKLRASFIAIPDEIAAAAIALKKKYPTPRRTKLPAYIGYVKIGGGCIQIDTVDEIPQILADFPKGELEIHIYHGSRHLFKVSEGNKLETGAIPKITTGDIYGLKSNEVVTVNINEGTACVVKGFIPGLREAGYFYTTPLSKAISRNGEIRTIDVTQEFPIRKSISRGAATKVVYIYPDPKIEHYVLALNTDTPNTIVIQRVKTDRTKITMNPVGEVLLVHSVDPHCFLNIPSRFLNRSSTRVVEFKDLEALLAGKHQAFINLTSADAKQNKLIRQL